MNKFALQQQKNTMIIIDAAIFITIIGLLHYYKSTHPNFLFFCKGAVLFLPPDDQQQPEPNPNPKQSGQKSSNDKKSQKEGHQISVIQVEYNHVKTYPFCTEYERIVMTMVGLLVFYCVRLIFGFVLPVISLLPFYILVAILVYTVKVSVDTFMVSAYKSKTVFMIALGVNVFYLCLGVALSNYEGVFDQTMKFMAGDYAKRLQVVLGIAESNSGNTIASWINQYTVLGMVVFMNFFITLAAIPTIVKFGNWYSKTLKEVYYEEDEDEQTIHKVLNNDKESTKQTQRQLKLNSKHTVSLLNYYLFATLLFIFFSHRFALTYIPEIIVNILRLVFLFISTSIILWTAKDAMQFNGSFAYKAVMEYFNEKSKEGRLMLRKKIIPYIYHIWYHFHQFMFRIMIPLLLVMLIVHWKYLAGEENIVEKNIAERDVNYDVECGLDVGEMDLIKNLYKCPIKTYKQMQMEQNLVTSSIISGVIRSQNSVQPPSVLQERILTYGLIKRSFMAEFSQLLLWYSNITIYGMTVIYVLFLRKTVYQI